MGVSAPLGVLAELTHRCPLGCAYCSNPLALVRRDRELSTGEWIAVFEQAARAGVLQLHLSGGEPASRGDLERLVVESSRAGLYTNLITSGVGLDRARLAALARAGLDHLQLSVQSSDEAQSDRIAGLRGSFRRKAELARWALELELPLTLNAVLHRDNVDDALGLVALARRWGARRVELAHVQLAGWAWENRSALVASDEQVARASAAIEGVVREDGLVIEHVRADTHAGRPKACMGGWGALFMVVAPDGAILPCHAAASLPLAFPRFPETGLMDAWRSEPFERFRSADALSEPCRSCPEHAHDHGGCRCQAFAASGDMGATDPACDRSVTREPLVALRSSRHESARPRRFAR